MAERGSIGGGWGDPGPPVLSGSHRIAVWAPGTEVRFEKPLSPPIFFRLPFTLALLAGPAMWIAMGRRQQPDLAGQVMVSAVVALLGLWLGLSNLYGALLAMPERITFDWTSGRMRISGRRRNVEVPLEAITAIEVKGIWDAVLSGGSDTDVKSTTYRYRCQLRADYGTRTIELAETARVDEDPAAALREASTVASELAAALGVEHRVTDFTPRPPRPGRA